MGQKFVELTEFEPNKCVALRIGPKQSQANEAMRQPALQYSP